MTGAITRVAPTPSGYLHEGNVVNFLLIDQLATEIDAKIALRIDDADSGRCRREYVDDIFGVLDWLNIDWELGPRDADDQELKFTQRARTDYYRDALTQARSAGLDVFACTCSRSALAGGRCVHDCRESGGVLRAGESSARVGTPHGDIVLWRRDDQPAYHLTSIIDDRDLRTTHIVRGSDLRESSELQRRLAPYFGADNVTSAVFLHHDLVLGTDGSKLSKSQLATGPLIRDAKTRVRLHLLASVTELA